MRGKGQGSGICCGNHTEISGYAVSRSERKNRRYVKIVPTAMDDYLRIHGTLLSLALMEN